MDVWRYWTLESWRRRRILDPDGWPRSTSSTWTRSSSRPDSRVGVCNLHQGRYRSAPVEGTWDYHGPSGLSYSMEWFVRLPKSRVD